MSSNFELIAKTKIDSYIATAKYKSKATGLNVILADVDGPVVNGYYVLATEAHDDDGLPHTLEHLIFLGSEKYPFKGVLDLLANRCLASGTNAWTDTDHTCYTMTTAGSDGFLELMPIYIDHILYPTLSDSGFATEVHHINAEGEDAGVVYCEMQGRENTGESRAHLQMLRSAYPKSGYSSETGGIMHNIRTSCSNTKVKNYHAQFYRPENLTLIIAGKIEADKVFQALQPIENKIIHKGNRSDFVQPWRTPVEPLSKSCDVKILYPSDEEDCGLVYIAYRGPNCINDYKKLIACTILLRYLSDTSVSPLQKEFVEIDDPFASKVSHSVIENLESLFCFVFDNVPLNKIDLLLGELKKLLNKFITGEEIIDMKRMTSILEREILEALGNLETDPHDTVAYKIIGDVIYGKTEIDFKERLNTNLFFEEFLKYDENYWKNLMKEYLIDGHFVCIRAYPSIEEQERMSKEELDRIENQRQKLGPQGLATKAEEIMKAMAKNEIEPPEKMLTEVKIPGINGINFHSLKIYKSSHTDEIKDCVKFSDFPVYAEFYDINTNFIEMTVTLNTSKIKVEHRPYLMLMFEMLLEVPIKKNDQIIPYEEVVAALERDTISSSTSLGIEGGTFSVGPFSHVATLTLQVEPKKYETGVQWIIDLLHSSEFTVERIRVCASKMFNAVSQAKRKGNSVVRDLLKTMYYGKDTIVQLSSMLSQQKFLGDLIERIENPIEADKIVCDFNTIRSTLLQNENVAVHIAANIKNYQGPDCKVKLNLSAPWKDLLKTPPAAKKELIVIPDWKVINPNGVYPPEFQGTVVGMGCVESAFLFHSTPSLNDFMDPDLPGLNLYIQYLTQLEGPLWRQIRGQGFAYGYNIVPRPHEGMLCLSLYRASNVVAAFNECKKIIENHLADEFEMDEKFLESARSSLIFEIIEREKSVGNLVSQSLLFSFKKVSVGYNQFLVKKINEVTKADLKRIGQKYISRIFAKESKTAIVCHPDKVKEVVAGFEKMDRILTPANSLEESILAK